MNVDISSINVAVRDEDEKGKAVDDDEMNIIHGHGSFPASSTYDVNQSSNSGYD